MCFKRIPRVAVGRLVLFRIRAPFKCPAVVAGHPDTHALRLPYLLLAYDWTHCEPPIIHRHFSMRYRDDPIQLNHFPFNGFHTKGIK